MNLTKSSQFTVIISAPVSGASWPRRALRLAVSSADSAPSLSPGRPPAAPRLVPTSGAGPSGAAQWPGGGRGGGGGGGEVGGSGEVER